MPESWLHSATILNSHVVHDQKVRFSTASFFNNLTQLSPNRAIANKKEDDAFLRTNVDLFSEISLDRNLSFP